MWFFLNMCVLTDVLFLGGGVNSSCVPSLMEALDPSLHSQ